MVVFFSYLSDTIKTYFFPNGKIKIAFSLAIGGTLEMVPFPGTALTPSAHILKAKNSLCFLLVSFLVFSHRYAMPNNSARSLM